MRKASIERKTTETEITVTVDLDGSGAYDVKTGIGFLDHMLEQLARHSLIDITLKAKGDLHIDFHHTAEDFGHRPWPGGRQGAGRPQGHQALCEPPSADGRGA